MTDADLDFVLDGYRRFNEGERVPELWFWHEDAEYHVAREDPDSSVHRGIESVRRQFASWVEAYPDLTVEPLDARINRRSRLPLGPVLRARCGERDPARDGLAHVYEMRDGKAARCSEYLDRDEGLRAAGLTP